MPDRDKVQVGDTVYAVFFNGGFSRFCGKVQESSEGLFIWTETVKDDKQGRIRLVGYLKNADEVRKAEVSEGNLCFCHGFRFQQPNDQPDIEGDFLVCVPMLKEGVADFEDTTPEGCLPEPEKLEDSEAELLGQIAERLGCKLLPVQRN